MGIKEEFLRLLKEDEEFRLAMAGLLGYSEIVSRLNEHEKTMQTILNEIKLLREDFNKLFEEQKKLREDFNKLFEEQKKLREDFVLIREDFSKLGSRVEVILGRMGRRWGADLERTLLGTFKEVLEKEGIEPGKVESFSYIDFDGSITGLKGRLVQADILVKDGKLTLIEVKSFAEREDVDHLKDVVGYVEKILKRNIDQVYLITVNVDKHTLARAQELGFKVIYGSLVE
ncbi:hypothetical protein B9Q00_06355 [Candidatus Marsarchaeota G1 archaeon OSP_C]|jgi:Uncharacterized conserved protein containing a coiled-coil domain|uniref:Microtubule-binding protein n=1 Tax=Candidatus Marsarchaeota G1 archaeon OSP_C TaxID=1978154 RepID=A0A2R6APE1_9ARCH|nr:MAG: hypothetical protein B9Q00_06355 [Candidatus Marsarchaeota G1 archaeon OSP_C]